MKKIFCHPASIQCLQWSHLGHAGGIVKKSSSVKILDYIGYPIFIYSGWSANNVALSLPAHYNTYSMWPFIRTWFHGRPFHVHFVKSHQVVNALFTDTLKNFILVKNKTRPKMQGPRWLTSTSGANTALLSLQTWLILRLTLKQFRQGGQYFAHFAQQLAKRGTHTRNISLQTIEIWVVFRFEWLKTLFPMSK